jgi:uncharacterized protein YkwD
MLLAALLATMLISLGLIAPAEAGNSRGHMLNQINRARAWAHIRGLRYSSRIAQGASAWARHLMASNTLAHSALRAGVCEGEIIEWHTGTRANIARVVNEWLASPEHHAVMLDGGFRSAGAGIAVGRMGGQWATVWVVRFLH